MYASLKRHSLWLGVLLVLVMGSTALAHDAFVPCPDPVGTHPAVPTDFTRLNYLFESFEGSVPPAGWSIMTSGVSTTWEQSSAMVHSGDWSAVVHYGPQGAMQDEWLVTPALDFTGAAALYLEFFEDQAYWDGYGLRHHLAVSTTVPDDPAAFTMVETWTPSDHTVNGFGGDPVVLNLSDYAGMTGVYFAFRYEGDWADDWFIDDVRIYEPSDYDLAALEARPHDHVDVGVMLVPVGLVKNVGLNTVSCNVRYEILVEDAVVYSNEVGIYLAPDTQTYVDFEPFTPDAEGVYYETVVTTLLDVDEDPSNDEARGGFNTYPLGHVPLAFLFTNSGCGPCVQANQGWDAYMAEHGDENQIALMRIHAWWPYAGDIMYVANSSQCTAYINEYGVNGVPDMWLDGLASFGTDTQGIIAAAEDARFDPSPMSVTPLFWNTATEQLTVEVDIQSTMPPGVDLRLVSCITEDGIEHNGGNGEPIHNQAFLYAYPDMDGTAIPSDIGTYTYTVDMPLNPLDDGTIPWEFANLRATCYVQDRGSADFRKIYETGTRFLTEIMDVTPVALSAFDLSSRPGAVDIAWESATELADFRLMRFVDGVGTQLAYATAGQGRYTAEDLLPEGGDAQYQLYGRQSGEDWMFLRSENVQVDPAVLVSRLDRCWPNPFNPKTTVRYTLAEAGPVQLSVFDLQGRLVADLFAGTQSAGSHTVTWDAGDLGSGVYFVRLTGERLSESQKVVLTK